MDTNDDDLWGMSDDELESAFKEAQASEASPDTDIEDEILDPDTSEVEEVDEPEEGSDEEDNELDDSPEQPEEEEETSKDSDDLDTDPDKEGEGDDSKPSEEDTEESTDKPDVVEESKAQVHKFKANGRDYEFTSAELVEQFPKIFGQAMDYTKKMQTIKPWRKTIDAIEGAELSHEDVSLMIDVMKGDKEAITEVLKRTGTDALELDTEKDSQYVAKDYGRDDNTLAVADIIGEISQDPEYSTTKSILSQGGWDDSSWKTMSSNPEMIRLLHEDVKSGMYTTLQPAAEKLKVYDGGKKSDLEYYKEAATAHFNEVAKQEAVMKQQEVLDKQRIEQEQERQRLAQVKAQTEKRNATKEASTKRKAAAPTKAASPGTKVVDYLSDDDEAFDEWYKKLQEDM